MHEKMTDEELATALRDVASAGLYDVSGWLRAHIAALTAGRDAAMRERDDARKKHGDALVRYGERRGEMERERDALRERVQALEKEVRAAFHCCGGNDAHPPEHTQDCDLANAERTLAAIRQRVGDVVEGRAPKHVYASESTRADYVLGEDGAGAEPLHCCGTTTDIHRDGCPHAQVMASLAATSAKTEPQCSLHPGRKCDPETPGVFECRVDGTVSSEMDGLRGEMAEVDCDVDGKGRAVLSTVPVEPTTAEAFATVRRLLQLHHERPLRHSAYAALSLLEVRMGAMCVAIGYAGEALEHMGDVLNGMDAVDSDDPADAAAIRNYERFNALRATIDDAPPVFTLEEVRQAMDHWCNREQIDEVSKRLSALRKVTP